jgi:hypothetical protein
MSNDTTAVVGRVRVQIRGNQSDTGLKLTHDRKVSPRGYYQESRKRWVAKIPNSFGLPSGDSCPGRTAFCDSCYATGSEQGAGVRDMVEHNLRLLQQAESVAAMAALIDAMIGRYLVVANHHKVVDEERIFRIHWDGDFFSEDYARAWRMVILNHPEIAFWAYTRSFTEVVNVVPILTDIPNLELYLSVDEDNVELANPLLKTCPSLLAAYCSEDYRSARKLVEDRRPLVCPENAGRMELMADAKGACVTCGICPTGRRDILFSKSGRKDVSQQLVLPLGTIPTRVGNCANTACNQPILRSSSGRGRPAKWCSPNCRWVVYRARKKTKADSSVL